MTASGYFDLIASGTHPSAFWICGPAGSGKTTLVNTYLDFYSRPCIWYELDESDSDIASFFYYLGWAARRHFSEDAPMFPLLTSEYFQGITEALLVYNKCRAILKSALGVSPPNSFEQLTGRHFKS